MDLFFYVILASLLGSRLFFIVINYNGYLQDPLSALKVWEGGLVFYGGLLFAIPTAIFYIRKKGLPLGILADAFAPPLALGHAVGRWGCFFAGCCFGSPTDLPWAVRFTDLHSLAPQGDLLHPTQIYSSLMNFGICLVLIGWERWNKVRPPGQVFWLYLLLYSIGRFGIEFFRGDERGIVFQVFSMSQFLGIFLALLAGIMLLRARNVGNQSALISR
jgi:phosphatidylglycerol:prolipoprotein diacylglycerol transferase